MIRLLIQSDDYGITNGVSAGIRDGIHNGIIRNTGIFINMPSSIQAAQEIKDMDVCLGIDINYVCGKPVSDASFVPHLVNQEGYFYKSGEISQKYQILNMDDFGLISFYEQDPYPYDEIYLETKNQVEKFIEVVGRLPYYIHAHSICTPNTHRAAQEVAKKYGIHHSFDMMYALPYLPQTYSRTKGIGIDEQCKEDITESLLEELSHLEHGKTYYYISHCGYLDSELFKQSSLTIRRMKDLEALTSRKVLEYIHRIDIELITYKDL